MAQTDYSLSFLFSHCRASIPMAVQGGRRTFAPEKKLFPGVLCRAWAGVSSASCRQLDFPGIYGGRKLLYFLGKHNACVRARQFLSCDQLLRLSAGVYVYSGPERLDLPADSGHIRSGNTGGLPFLPGTVRYPFMPCSEQIPHPKHA